MSMAMSTTMRAAMSEWTPRAELGRRPIREDAPVGLPIDDDATFQAFQEEVLRNPMHGVLPSWPLAVKLGTEILATKSKDLTVACYLCVALTQAEQLVGLRDGLRIVLGLVEGWWDTAHPELPKRIRKRVNSLDALADRCLGVVTRLDPAAQDAEVVQDCFQACSELLKLASEKLEGREIVLGKLLAALRELSERRGAAKPSAQTRPDERPRPIEPRPETAPVVRAPTPTGGASASQVAITSASDVPLLLLRCAGFLRGKDPKEPLGYRLPRLARWAEIQSTPPDQRGRVALKGPGADEIGALRALLQQQQWSGLLDAVEDAFWQNWLWLDLQRLASEALDGLGSGFQSAAAGVREDVRSLLERAPGLPRLAFSDGTPLADAETQRWLETQLRATAAASPTAPPRSAEPGLDADALEAARAEARVLMRRGNVASALLRIEQALGSPASSRGRFAARLELAAFCADAGQDRLALALFAELDEQVVRHGLELWDPELSTRVLELAYRASQRVAATEDSADARQRVESIYRRLCRLSPAAAAALG